MKTAFIPASANIICRHGNDILFIQRSEKAKTWPNFWAFPWGKVDDNEFFREAWLRELEEEVGIVANSENILQECLVMMRTNQWTKIHYFGIIEDWFWMPEILEKKLISDLKWFSLSDLPSHISPHHLYAIEAMKQWKHYIEIDVTP